jgi:hypothetical protein
LSRQWWPPAMAYVCARSTCLYCTATGVRDTCAYRCAREIQKPISCKNPTSDTGPADLQDCGFVTRSDHISVLCLHAFSFLILFVWLEQNGSRTTHTTTAIVPQGRGHHSKMFVRVSLCHVQRLPIIDWEDT